MQPRAAVKRPSIRVSDGQREAVSGLVLVLPALLVLCVLYIYPLCASIAGSFVSDEGIGLHNFAKAFTLYGTDILFTIGITIITLVLVFVVAVLTASFLGLELALLNFVYRLPLFIPYLIAGHTMRVFLAPMAS